MGIGNIGRFRHITYKAGLGYIIKITSYLMCLLVVINMANLERGNMRGPCLSTFFKEEFGLWCSWQKLFQLDTQVTKTEQCF